MPSSRVPRRRAIGAQKNSWRAAVPTPADLFVLGLQFITDASVFVSPWAAAVTGAFASVPIIRWVRGIRVRDPWGWNDLARKSGRRPSRFVHDVTELTVRARRDAGRQSSSKRT